MGRTPAAASNSSVCDRNSGNRDADGITHRSPLSADSSTDRRRPEAVAGRDRDHGVGARAGPRWRTSGHPASDPGRPRPSAAPLTSRRPLRSPSGTSAGWVSTTIRSSLWNLTLNARAAGVTTVRRPPTTEPSTIRPGFSTDAGAAAAVSAGQLRHGDRRSAVEGLAGAGAQADSGRVPLVDQPLTQLALECENVVGDRGLGVVERRRRGRERTPLSDLEEHAHPS